MIIRTMAVAGLAVAMLAACSKTPDAGAAADATDHTEHAALPRKAAPAGASVFFVSPKDGDAVASPVKVEFGISGMALAPAGEDTPGTGHHHLLIDTDLADPAVPIPADDRHVHFGKAQTETTVNLPPGQHTLQLVLGDYLHIPFDPVIASPKITITVK